MRLLLVVPGVLLFCLAMSGCGAVGDPMPPLLDIPKPTAGLSAVQRGDKILVSWPAATLSTENLPPRPDHLGAVKVYRAVLDDLRKPSPDDSKKLVEIESLPAGSLDYAPKIEPAWINHTVIFAIKMTNRRGDDGGTSNVVPVAVLNVLPAPTVQSELTATAIKLSWDAPEGATYRVYRDGAQLADVVGGQYEDTHFEFDKTYTYTVRSLARRGSYISEGDDSKPATVPAIDKFPPAAPEGLRALTGDNAIDLSWSPNTEPDLAGYNVYRNGKKLNEKPFLNTVYHDPAPGASPKYRITAVDTHDNESEPSTEVVP